MDSAQTIKRKNIDLPNDTWQKLSLMAVASGKSLKSYVEALLKDKADSISVRVESNPSPSGDEWFGDERNRKMVEEGVRQKKAGEVKAYTIEDIKQALGV